MERCPPPSRRRLIFSACNNLYRENNGLDACESRSKESEIFYLLQPQSLQIGLHIEHDYQSDIEEFGPKKSSLEFLKILVNFIYLLGFLHFLMFSYFYVFKEQ